MPDSFIAAPPKDLVLDDGFRFVHGQTIAPFTILYETFGELNADRVERHPRLPRALRQRALPPASTRRPMKNAPAGGMA